MASPLWFVILFMASSVSSLGVTLLKGDVYVQFIAALYLESGPDGSCSSIEAESVQNMFAVKWTLSRLNAENYIDGVKIGLQATHTCLKPDEDKRIALQLAADLQENRGENIIGLIGPDYSSESESVSRLLSSLPPEYRLLQLGFSATSSSLRDRSTFKNFFRTIPPDNIQVEVMQELITELNMTYMAILYSDDAYGQGGTEALLKSTEGLDVCFPARIPINQGINTITKLEDIVKKHILDAKIPISGIIVFGSSALAEHVLEATDNILNANASFKSPVFLFSEAGNTIVGQESNVSRGAYVLSPRKKTINEFQNYWKGLFKDTTFSKLYSELEKNEWLRDLYESKFNCNLARAKENNICPSLSIEQVDEALPISVYNQYAIQAALVMAKVTKQVLFDICGKENVCSDFNNTAVTKRNAFIEKLNTMTIRFDDDFDKFRLPEFQAPDLVINFNGTCEAELPDQFPLYEVYNHRKETLDKTRLYKVAEYSIESHLKVDTEAIKDYDPEGNELSWPNIRKPQCPNGEFCSKCLNESDDHSRLYIHGDMYIVGVVPVHSKGKTPLKCGAIKEGGVDLAETIRFAVQEAKVTPNAKIGVIVINSCNDPQLIQEKILTLHKFGVLLNDGQYEPVRDKIIGYIGGWSSDVSKAVAAITSRLEYVQISYASTATVLSKRLLYPYFLRTPTPDDQQALLLLKIVREFNANLIQILYSESEYGEGGRDVLLRLIGSEYQEICVSQTIPVSTSSNPTQIIQQLRKSPQAKIVILFVGSFGIAHIVSELNTLTRNEFLLITSEGWGTRFDLAAYKNLIGTITVTSELTINEKLKDHIKSLSPAVTNVDPWIRDYIEREFDCYFEWSFNKSSDIQCQGEESLDVYSGRYRIDTWSPFAERAVISLLDVAKQVLDQKCANSTYLCKAFREDTVTFVEQLKNYRYQGDTQNLRLYDDNGDGTAGYSIYTVTLDNTGTYRKIGVQEPGAFTFQKSVYNNIRGEIINSTCSSNVAQCNVCFPVPPTIQESQGLSTAVIIVIALLGIVCCVLAGVLLFFCNRNGCCFKLENGRLQFTSTYLTPIYMQDRALHAIDGSDSNQRDMRHEENYDSIPPSSISYIRSNSSLSGGRMPVSEGSSSSTDRGPSGGSSGGSRARQNKYIDENVMGRDNIAFEREQRSMTGTDMQSGDASSDQGYLAASPPPHVVAKTSRAAPPPQSNVVYQADGSYITATNRQVSAESKVSAGSQTDLELQQLSASSDKSVGYLGKVKLAD